MTTKKLAVLIFSFLLVYTANAQRHTFEIKAGSFLYDGKPIQIHSGEMHFARVPEAYWRHRLQMLKAMGLNAVATYVFWNYHHPSPSVWDFSSGNKNIAGFIRTAQQEGLFVILRPGPYACAEWEFGGYPWWLQKDAGLVIRTYNNSFLDSCKTYINKLAAQVKDLQVTKGGPVIMVQAENEFGSYVSQRKDIPIEQHRRYNLAIKKMLLDAGIEVPLFTSDGTWLFDGGSMEGALPTGNGEGNVTNLKKAVNKYHHNEGPYMVAEYYPGWLDHWAEPFQQVSTAEVVKQLKLYLDSSISFNIYMVHGGTNFGFTSGANYNNDHHIQPDITSYDYDAPISEAGWATPKYNAVRELMQQYTDKKLPAVPKQIPVITIPPVKLQQSEDLLSGKRNWKAIKSDTVLSFEDLNQGHGYVLYSRRFTQPMQGKLQLTGLRDYATVYVNGEFKGFLNRVDKKYTLDIDVPFNATLDILVENMGRINYGAEIVHNKKGIISPVLINDTEVTGNWEMIGWPFSTMPVITGHLHPAQQGRPALYSGSFEITGIGDTFLDMRAWGKGIVFVNGYNLGRYWSAGPQQTLYLPGTYLKKGKNSITVFEQLNENIQPVIPTLATPILNELKTSIKTR